MSKAGVVMLTRTLALALAPDITVNAMAPGAVLPPDEWDEAARQHLARTTPLKRLGSPGDVAGALLYLLEAGLRHRRHARGGWRTADPVGGDAGGGSGGTGEHRGPGGPPFNLGPRPPQVGIQFPHQ